MRRAIAVVVVLAAACGRQVPLEELTRCEHQRGGSDARLALAQESQAAAERKAEALEQELRELRAQRPEGARASAEPVPAAEPALAAAPGTDGKGRIRIAMVVKSVGNGFFEAARDGGQEAARELREVELLYLGPTTPTPEGQIEIVNSLIAQKVDAIVVSANDGQALVQVSKKAMQRGIPVISFDSAIAKGGRLVQINPSSPTLIGQKQIEMAARTLGGTGEIAVLSATAKAPNQNSWIQAMKRTLQRPEHAGLRLVEVAYGDDQPEKSYTEAVRLLERHPDLKAIIAPTTVGIAAAARAVTDRQLTGKVHVTGLGLPSEMADHVHSGVVDTFAIWNPVDLGYTAVYAAHSLATRKSAAKPNAVIPVGRMGKLRIDQDGECAMAEPFVFDRGNVDRFAKFF